MWSIVELWTSELWEINAELRRIIVELRRTIKTASYKCNILIIVELIRRVRIVRCKCRIAKNYCRIDKKSENCIECRIL